MKIRIGRNVDNSFIYYTFIALFCMNFLRRGGVVCFLFGLLMFFRLPMRFQLDISYLVTFFSAIMISVFGAYHYGWMEAVKSINIFLMYHVGYQGCASAKNKEEFLRQTILAVYAGFSIFLALTYIYNLLVGFETHYRTLQDIWDGELVSVTLIGLLTSVIAPCSFYSFFCTRNKGLKVWSVFSLLTVFLTNMHTATRTPYVLLLLVYFVMSLIYVINQNHKKAANFLFFSLLLLALGAFLYVANFFGVKHYVENSRIFERFMQDGLDTGRFDLGIKHFRYMLDYMWGGEYIYKAVGGHAHNIVQQCYDLYGCLAAAGVTWIVYLMGMTFWKFLQMRNKRDVDYLVVAMYFSVLLQMFIEPIMTGYPALLWSMLLIHGIARAYLREK